MSPLAKKFSTGADIVCYNPPVLIFVCTKKDEQWDNVNLLDCNPEVLKKVESWRTIK
jgi:hypothetical protein